MFSRTKNKMLIFDFLLKKIEILFFFIIEFFDEIVVVF